MLESIDYGPFMLTKEQTKRRATKRKQTDHEQNHDEEDSKECSLPTTKSHNETPQTKKKTFSQQLLEDHKTPVQTVVCQQRTTLESDLKDGATIVQHIIEDSNIVW